MRSKGRKQRSATLTPETVAVLREWMRERDGHAHEPLFPTRRGGPLTTRAVALLLDKHVAAAAHQCPSLVGKRVTPHVLRHYVDGWVMWPAGVFPLLDLSRASVLAT